MGPPPRVTDRELERALARILARHAAHDPRHSEMGTEPRAVLEHLQRHSIGLPHPLQADDVADALVLDAALWWTERERHRSLLRRARALGMSLSEIGSRLGVASKSAARDHLDRLDAEIELTAPAGFVRTPPAELGPRRRARPDGIEGWAGQRASAHSHARDRRHRAAGAAGDQAWLHTHGPTAMAVITRLVTQIERALPQAAHAKDPELAPDDTDDDTHDDARPTRYGAAATAASYPQHDPDHDLGEWVDELRADLGTAPESATMATLALVLGELDVHPAARALDPAHGLHRARRAAHRLRAAYGAHRSPRGI